MLAGGGGAGDRAWAGCCHAWPCSRKMLQGQRNMSGAHGASLSSIFQLVCLSQLLVLARDRDGWGWHGLEGARGGLCRQWGFRSALLPSLAALLPLAKDTDLSVRSLAAQTIYILTGDMRTSGWSLRSLCCWPC